MRIWLDDERPLPAGYDRQVTIRVGIFWWVAGELVGDAVPLDQAEPYGEALQYGGHYEFWERLRPCNRAERRLRFRAYDAWPRGRAVFFPSRQMLRICVDPCLAADAIMTVRSFFGVADSMVEIAHDEHYQCATCNPNFLDEQ